MSGVTPWLTAPATASMEDVVGPRPSMSAISRRDVSKADHLEVREAYRYQHSVRVQRTLVVSDEHPPVCWQPEALDLHVVGGEMRGGRPACNIDVVVMPPQKSSSSKYSSWVGQWVDDRGERHTQPPQRSSFQCDRRNVSRLDAWLVEQE